VSLSVAGGTADALRNVLISNWSDSGETEPFRSSHENTEFQLIEGADNAVGIGVRSSPNGSEADTVLLVRATDGDGVRTLADTFGRLDERFE